ncbi:MAG: ABC transporter substrate-binding protein [Deltaproteobacteria bacterium]|nr:ABC transporter substrate-binding protein [Deltaproteobacteria bacterium]
MRSRLSRYAVVVLFVTAALSVSVSWNRASAAMAQAPEGVSFALDWIVYGKHALFYPAIDLGIYKKNGLSVNMVRGFGSGDTIQKVDQKTFQFGFADLASLVILRAKGAKVVEVGMIHHLMPHAILFLKDSGIKTPKDLEGRTFSTPAGNAVWVLLPAFAKAAGFDHAKIQHIPADVPASRAALLAGRVAAVGVFWPEYPPVAIEAKKLGKEVGYFKYSDYGLDLYANGIIVHEGLVREKPDLVRTFVGATFEGIRWALNNPKKAFEMYMKHNPEQDSEKAWGEWTTGMDMFGDVAKKAKRPLQLAWMDPAKVKRTIEVIGDLYKLESPVKPEEVYTNKFAERLRP